MVRSRSFFRAAAIAAVCVATSQCDIWGARTGLLVPEVGPDVFDAMDVQDIVDTPDIIEACVPGTFPLTPRVADVMFVIDRSGSMDWNLAGDYSMPPSRWDLLHQALSQALPRVQNQLAAGAIFFPGPVSDPADISMVCGVLLNPDVPIGYGHAAPILAVFDNTAPNGGTPTFEAIGLAEQVLQTSGGRGDGRYVILATDGGPNCNDRLDYSTCVCTSHDMFGNSACAGDPQQGVYECLDDSRTVNEISIVASHGIPVYVIGIATLGDPVFIDVLNRMADAGGRANTNGPYHFYSVDRPEDVLNAFTTIQNAIARCAYVTPSVPDNPDGIRVFVNGTQSPRDTTHATGWDWTDEAFGEITFFGTACDQIVADPTATVTAQVGCDDGG